MMWWYVRFSLTADLQLKQFVLNVPGADVEDPSNKGVGKKFFL